MQRGTFLVSDRCFPQTIDVLRSRAEPLGIELEIGPVDAMKFDAPACSARSCSIPTKRAARRPEAVHRQGARRRRRWSRSRPICSRSRSRRRRAKSAPTRVRQLAALRRAARIRWSARRVLRDQPGIRAPHARAASSACRSTRRGTRLSHVAADARTAHPPREGDVEHLHRAGAARQHGGDVRRVSRSRGHQGDRDARPRADARARAARSSRSAIEQQNADYFDTLRIESDAAASRRFATPRSRGASTSATSTTPRSASRSTRR